MESGTIAEKIISILRENASLSPKEIKQVLGERGFHHAYEPIMYALIKLCNMGLVGFNIIQKPKRPRKFYYLKEWYQRQSQLRQYLNFIDYYIGTRRLRETDEEKEAYNILNSDERLEIEYLWAEGIFKTIDRLWEILVDKRVDFPELEDVPPRRGIKPTPYYPDEKGEKTDVEKKEQTANS